MSSIRLSYHNRFYLDNREKFVDTLLMNQYVWLAKVVRDNFAGK